MNVAINIFDLSSYHPLGLWIPMQKSILSTSAAMWVVTWMSTIALSGDRSSNIAPMPRLVEPNDPASARAKYQVLFKKLSVAELKELSAGSNLSLSLQASWEGNKRLIKRDKKPTDPMHLGGLPQSSYDPAGVDAFLHVLKRRTLVTAPTWWTGALKDLAVRPGDLHLNLNAIKPRIGYKTIMLNNINWNMTKDSDLTNEKNIITYKNDDIKISFYKSPQNDDKFTGDAIAATKNGQVVALATYQNAFGSPFYVHCFNAVNGKHAWEAKVWALGRRNFGGTTDGHRVELILNKESLFVFGEDITGFYVEAFRTSDGSPLFRFCTMYWGDYSEEWLKR